MLRLISIAFLAFLAFLILRTFAGFFRVFTGGGKRDRGRERLGGEMAEDPVCHTYIPKATAVQRRISGEIYYFCGTECADSFSGKQP